MCRPRLVFRWSCFFQIGLHALGLGQLGFALRFFGFFSAATSLLRHFFIEVEQVFNPFVL